MSAISSNLSFCKRNYYWLGLIYLEELQMSIIKRYMRQGRFNFFQSPHPRHLDFNHLNDARYHCSEDPDNHEERLFLTPLRPRPVIEPYFTQPAVNKRAFNEDLFLDNSELANNPEDSQQSLLEIDQKVEFSEEEELLLPLTPQKVQVMEEENMNTTAKKDYEAQNALSESRFYERGLKKLAYEAFQFVSQQKKTTYKEVATNLIGKINDERMLDAHKKGEMNIKRRVYDALNVLIALGLLKRNGNKILGKKHDAEAIFLEREAQKENQRKKEALLEDQLQTLRNDYNARAESLRQKENLVSKLKEKISKMKQITDRNIHRGIKEGQERDNIVPLPFLGICLAEKQQRHKGGSNELLINQKSQQNLHLSFNPEYNIQLLGDLDLIENYYCPIAELKTPVKAERKRKK